MPIYAYACTSCNHKFEEFRRMAESDAPCSEACPSCGKDGVTRDIGACGNVFIDADHVPTPNEATGGDWDRLMSKIKKGVPKRFHDNLDRSSENKGLPPSAPTGYDKRTAQPGRNRVMTVRHD